MSLGFIIRIFWKLLDLSLNILKKVYRYENIQDNFYTYPNSISLKLENRARRWRTAWCFKFFLNTSRFASLYWRQFYALIPPSFFFFLIYVLHTKPCCANKKIISHKNYAVYQNYVRHKKHFMATKNFLSLPKESLMLTKYG